MDRESEEFLGAVEALQGWHSNLSHHETSALRQYFLDQAESLGEVAEISLGYLMEDARIGDKWDLALKKRLLWVSGIMWTLDEAASLVGVTRERMRQVQNKLQATSLDLVRPPRILTEVLDRGKQCSSIDEFFESLRESGLSGPEEDWGKQSLLELYSRIGNIDLVEALGRLFGVLSPAPRSASLDTAIRNTRIKLLGVVDLQQVVSDTGRDLRDVDAAVRRLYGIVLGSSHVVLAVQNPPAALVMSVAKQLLVNPAADASSLREGVERNIRQRGIQFSISTQDFETLVADIFGTPAAIENLPSELGVGIELSSHESAFVQAFESLGRNSLHRNELIEAAIRSGTSAISAGTYLSTSPIIRPSSVKRGYFRLV